MVWANGTENIQTRTPGHLQVENYSVGVRLLNTPNGLGHISGLPHNPDTGHISQEVRQALDDYF
jgi:hypothetical protein